MDATPIRMAIEKLRNRKQNALQEYERLLAMLVGGGTFSDPGSIAAQIVAAADAAGLTADDLEKRLASVPAPRRPIVHLDTGVNFGTGGGQYNSLHIDDLVRDGQGRIDLSGFQIEPTENQTADDIKQLVQLVDDFNFHRPGACEEGEKLLSKSGIPIGNSNNQGSTKNIAARFRLWQIRKSVIEAAIIKKRSPSQDLKELVYQRLGLGGLCEPVLTGGAV